MKIVKKETYKEDKLFGYIDNNTGIIYIDKNLNGLDYFLVLSHEIIHLLIWKLFGNNNLARFFHCLFDVADSIFGNFSISQAKEYYKYYYNKI